MKNKVKNIKLISCLISIIAILSMTGIFAYLTDVDPAYNKFTVGAVRIEVLEPHWSNSIGENGQTMNDTVAYIAPNAIIEKDPQIKNVGSNNAYVYFKVSIPVKNIVSANNNGELLNNGQPQYTPLFSYEINNKWTQIGERNVISDSISEIPQYYEYVYYYNEILEPQETTQSLFDNIKFVNAVDDQPDSSTYQIGLEAFAIQTDNLPEDITIEGAYNLYLNQTE